MFKIVTKCPICHTSQIADGETHLTGKFRVYELACGHSRALPIEVEHPVINRQWVENQLSAIETCLISGTQISINGKYLNPMEILAKKLELEKMLEEDDYRRCEMHQMQE